MPPVTIEKLVTEPYFLPLKSALSWGKGHHLKTLNHVLVKVYLSNGAMGFAEATPRPSIYGETPESVAAIIAGECAEALIGQPVESLADLHRTDEKLALIKNNNTAKGALNMALWSAYAQFSGESLADLLNVTQERVRLSYILGTGSVDAVLREVEEIYVQGVRVLKVKVGKDAAAEIELVRQLRVQYGAELDFYVDANECLDAEHGVTFLAQMREYGALYCEEPLPVHHLTERQRFRQGSPLPLIADDSCFTSRDLERELAFDTFDILNIKTARTGFSQSRTMLAQAQAHGKGIMIGSQASSLLGCLHAILFAAQSGIDHATEGSFFLKVAEASPVDLPVVEGYVTVTAALEALAQIGTQMP
jgi:L-alanine-DL-glutamate epimerase-like enolase superfamily enzyme